MASDGVRAGRGRQPAWVLQPKDAGPLLQDVVELESRYRISVPGRLAGDASWLSAGGGGLMVLSEPGRAVLVPWEPSGEAVLQRRRELLDAVVRGGEPEKLRALQLLDDRYRRYSVEAEQRLILQPPLLAHLEDSRVLAFVYLLRFVDRLEMWSIERRNRFLSDGNLLLEGLPSFLSDDGEG